jgi:hypothetical protein
MSDIDFTRGPYGEILPPPLVSGVDPDEALAQFVQAAERSGNPVTVPSRGQSRKGMINLAMLYAHQQNLKRALSDLSDDGVGDNADGQALYEKVVEDGELLSLRPLGLERLHFATFAPVLRHFEANRWRVGLPSSTLDKRGRTAVLEGEPGDVLEKAWALYVKWSAEESDQFGETVDKLLDAVPYSLNHAYWAGLLRGGQSAVVAQGVSVGWLGRHQTYRLTTQKGERIVEASSPERAARMAEALAQKARLEMIYPSASDVLDALLAEWALRSDGGAGDAPEPVQDAAGVWVIGDVRARWDGGGTIGIANRLAVLSHTARSDSRADSIGSLGIPRTPFGGATRNRGRWAYALLRDKGAARLVDVADSIGVANRGRQASEASRKSIGATALPPNLAQGLATADGQLALLVWAAMQLERTIKNGKES